VELYGSRAAATEPVDEGRKLIIMLQGARDAESQQAEVLRLWYSTELHYRAMVAIHPEFSSSCCQAVGLVVLVLVLAALGTLVNPSIPLAMVTSKKSLHSN
jgi:hypothetical protein